MKARQIAIALDSVYALSPSDELRHIERGSDGLWGRWSAVGERARSIVHGGPVIAGIGLDGGVAVLQRTPPLPWATLDLQASTLAVAHLPDGAPGLFAAARDGTVWHTWKPEPSSPWTDWQSLDGSFTGLTAHSIPGGGLAVFGIGDGIVFHRWQDRPTTDWKEWAGLDAPAGGVRAILATTISGGGLVVFALGGDDAVYHRWQDKPFAPWHEWTSLGGSAKTFAVAKSPTGGLAVFAIGADDGVAYRYQARPFGQWSRWTGLYGRARSIAAQMSYVDGLEVFVIGMDDAVYHKWCDRLDAPWTDWMPLERESSALRIARDESDGVP